MDGHDQTTMVRDNLLEAVFPGTMAFIARRTKVGLFSSLDVREELVFVP